MRSSVCVYIEPFQALGDDGFPISAEEGRRGCFGN